MTPQWQIEAWRGLAAWLVVYAHFQSLAGIDLPLLRFAFSGVDLFFALSGLVFAPYFAGKPLDLRTFAVRRLFRIYPAYLAALALYAALKWQAGGPMDYLWQHALLVHLQSREMAFHYNPAFWSLPVEVEFYAALPLLAGWSSKGRWHLPALLAGAILLRLVLGHASDPASQNLAYLWQHHLPGMGVEFLAGVMAGRLSHRLAESGWRWFWLLAGVTGWLGLATVFAAQGDAGLNSGWLRGQIGWLAATCFAVMLAASAGKWRHAPGWLIRLGLWGGRLSYGTYLLHIAVLRMVEPRLHELGHACATILACALTLAGAWLLYRLWEEPWRRFGRQPELATEPRRDQNTSVSPG